MNGIPPTRRGRAYIRVCKALRRWRSALLGLGGGAVESFESGQTIKFHGGVTDDGEIVVTTLRACGICAAFVTEENALYHRNWHIAGSTR